jgi:hypothetical protein
MLRTSDGRLAIIMMTFLLYVASPVIFWFALIDHVAPGAALPERDTPVIPFIGFMILWLIALPFVVIFCGLTEMLGRKYYGPDN